MALKDERIQERWEVLIENGQGQAEVIYQAAVDALERTQPPDTKWERRNIRAGTIITGRVYDFLYVRNSRLKDWRLYLTAYDYGTSLHVAWFLTIERGLLKRLFSTIFFWAAGLEDPSKIIFRMDIPKQLTLSAYTTTLHRGAQEGARVLMEKLNQDFSKVNTKSKGFLELW